MPSVSANKKFIFNQSDKTYIFRQERSVNIFSTFNLSQNKLLETFLQQVENKNIRQLLIPEIIRALLQENLFSHVCCESLKKRYTEIKENSKSATLEESKILKESIKTLISRIEKICMNNDEIIKAYIYTVICEKHIFLSDTSIKLVANILNKNIHLWKINKEEKVEGLHLIYPERTKFSNNTIHLFYSKTDHLFYELRLTRTILYRYPIKKEDIIIRFWKSRPEDRKKYYGHISLEIPTRNIYASFCPNLQKNTKAGVLIESFDEDKYNLNNREPDEYIILRNLNVDKIVKKYEEIYKRQNINPVKWNFLSSIRLDDATSGKGRQAHIGSNANCSMLIRTLLEAGGVDYYLRYSRITPDLHQYYAGTIALLTLSENILKIDKNNTSGIYDMLHYFHRETFKKFLLAFNLNDISFFKNIAPTLNVFALSHHFYLIFPVPMSWFRSLFKMGMLTTPALLMKEVYKFEKIENSLSKEKKKDILMATNKPEQRFRVILTKYLIMTRLLNLCANYMLENANTYSQIKLAEFLLFFSIWITLYHVGRYTFYCINNSIYNIALLFSKDVDIDTNSNPLIKFKENKFESETYNEKQYPENPSQKTKSQLHGIN